MKIKKKKFLKDEIKELKNKPEITLYGKSNESDSRKSFVLRMNKYEEDKKERIKNAKDKKEKDENEFLEHAKIKAKQKVLPKEEVTEFISKKINAFSEWEVNRKKKISDEIKKKEEEKMKPCTFKPKINGYKSSSGNSYNNCYNVTDRLFISDIEQRKQKIDILIDIHLPTFSPMLEKPMSMPEDNKYIGFPSLKQHNTNNSMNYNQTNYSNNYTQNNSPLKTSNNYSNMNTNTNINVYTNTNNNNNSRITSKSTNKNNNSMYKETHKNIQRNS